MPSGERLGSATYEGVLDSEEERTSRQRMKDGGRTPDAFSLAGHALPHLTNA